MVRVVDVPGVSVELCGGTHVANTAEIGLFKILAESGVAAGIRRIEAVAGPAVLAYFNERDAVVRALGDRFKAQPGENVEWVAALQEEIRGSHKALAAVRGELTGTKAAALAARTEELGAIPAGSAHAGEPFALQVERLDGVEGAGLQGPAQSLVDQLGEGGAVVLWCWAACPIRLMPARCCWWRASERAVIAAGPKAGAFIGTVAKACGGGGGRPNLAQAGGKDGAALDGALAEAKEQLREQLGVALS